MSTRWVSNGQKKSEIGYRNAEQTGPYRTWYKNGQQEKEGAYKAGKEDGPWVSWYLNGQKQRECVYKDGVLNGRWTSWYDNGQKEKEGVYKNGKENGKWVYWYANGQKWKEVSYKGRNSEWKFRSRDGQKRETGIVKDIDGNTYRTIKIGEQWWMAENLKVTRYRNGDPIPNVTGESAWSGLTTGAYCSYENDPANAETYGYLYNWYAVNDPRGLAPEGWHVPTDAEWKKLVEYLGGYAVAGGKLKDTGTTLWKESNTDATNESGFSALPGGYRHHGGYFDIADYYAYLWSSTENNRYSAWNRQLSYVYPGALRDYYSKRYGLSIRCIRD